MINKRLIHTMKESKKYIFWNVVFQWVALLGNIVMIFSIGFFLEALFRREVEEGEIVRVIIIMLASALLRAICTVASTHMGYQSSKSVKKVLRHRLYEKLLSLGSSYNKDLSTSEVVQVSVEGIEQLEIYFGAYLPQFFYSMVAPMTLFVVLSFVNVPAALVLLICVPMIPISIACVQTFAKKLLAKYWNRYTTMGDTFLENLQGLTTLKIYSADERKHGEMDEQAEEFRKITMKVLTMQLNSITIMDLIAFGGAALGIVTAVYQLSKGAVGIGGCIVIILLSADFFIPMRMLGSFFHIAMNGMAASERMFRILDMPQPVVRTEEVDATAIEISGRNVSFRYDQEREILKKISLDIPQNSFVSIVGESGSGKSTLAELLTGRNAGYSGSLKIGNKELSEISEKSLLSHVTYVGHHNYIFKGSVRENLLMAKPSADDEELWQIMERTKLADFLRSEQGLDTMVQEKGSNLSGGQCQRLSLGRALLHDSPIYIFDEATSNIDMESENDIMEEIKRLAGSKTVVMISHRIANAVDSDKIYVLNNGSVAECGTHDELLNNRSVYYELWSNQYALENYGRQVGV